MDISGVQIVKAAALLGAGICMGIGAIGPGVGEGFAAGKACEGISRNPEEAGLLTRTMLVGQAVSESTGIYALVIALLLIFVV
jgi:F-type H+-transporting ATPase subunit c